MRPLALLTKQRVSIKFGMAVYIISY